MSSRLASKTRPNEDLDEPLSEEEWFRLCDLLDAHSPLDGDAVLGLLNAVAVSPGLVKLSVWLDVVVPQGLAGVLREGGDVDALLTLLARRYHDVAQALAAGEAYLPEPDDEHGCASFARGYVAGAELDPAWFGDDDRWTFVAWAALLAGRPELIAKRLRDKMLRDPEIDSVCRRFLAASIRTTYDTFREQNKRELEEAARATMRVGRNDPCTCGSGKKFKRCCIGRARPIST